MATIDTSGADAVGAVGTGTETVDSFRLRARAWLAGNMPPARRRAEWIGYPVDDDVSEEEEMRGDRALQRRLYDGGFAGICFPVSCGGQGLTPAHQRAFCEELAGYDYPALLQVPTHSPCAAVLLEYGTPEQRAEHLTGILKGEEVWSQLLSEPSGGSDVAGAQTSAVRDGDEWVINGSKIWTSGAWMSDWGLALVRTNPDAAKHRGLTVFMVPFGAPGIELHRIEMLNGTEDFCQEFFTDVRIPDSWRIGEVDHGWTVATRWLYHERTVGGGSPYVSRPGHGHGHDRDNQTMVGLARATGKLGDPRARQLVAEAHVLDVVRDALTGRLTRLIRQGTMSEDGAAVGRLFAGKSAARAASIAFELAGSAAGAWEDGDDAVGRHGVNYLIRQSSCIGGGTTEMAANVVSERLLGMPRERTLDRDVAFRDIPKGPPAARRP
jgi:alkylation response protein AidB-like acyl-CoA dehydrogenase